MEIVWSQETLENYLRVIDFLLERWTMSEVEKFEINFNKILTRIKTHKESCPKSRLLNYRKCRIDENNSLIYQILDSKIFLITIVDNKSNHAY